MNSVPEIIGGVAVELGLAVLFGVTAYRLLAGRFLIPKREMVLPNQRGVIVQGDRQLRVVEPGRCWVRPGQKLILCDARPRKLQIEGFEVLSADASVLRLSIGGEYLISDPMTFLRGSSNAGDALYFELRRLLTVCAREQVSARITVSPDQFQQLILERANQAIEPLGLKITALQIWNIFERGRILPEMELGPTGLVH